MRFAVLQCPKCKRAGNIELLPWSMGQEKGMTGVSARCVGDDCEYMGILDLDKPTFTIDVGA